MVRVLSIWLPRLPLDRLVRRGDPRTDGLFAVTAEIRKAVRITNLTIYAREAGLTEGLSIPDARAICPDLLTEPCDPMREAALLRALARWADSLSPRVALNAPDGLLLDIAGCAHLFGGETAMCDHARQRLADMRITARMGIADTKSAARALARFGKTPIALAPTGRTSDAISALPAAALDLPDRTVAELARIGLKTIGQLYGIKASELARRFGLELTDALDRSRGHVPDPVAPYTPDSIFSARMSLPEPIGYLSDVEDVLRRLARSVCHRLRHRLKGARRFELAVRCVDSGDHLLSVGFVKPCFRIDPIVQQFARPLDDLKLEFGADLFRLVARQVEPIRFRQTRLGDRGDADDHLARVISTLGNRIGFDHVRRFRTHDSHLPERESFQVEAVAPQTDHVWRRRRRKRPLRLFPKPERLRALEPGRPPQSFGWRGQTHRTASANGPERLAPEWWRDGDARLRDYWRVQTADGPRLWLLTYPGVNPPDWFVAGRFP